MNELGYGILNRMLAIVTGLWIAFASRVLSEERRCRQTARTWLTQVG